MNGRLFKTIKQIVPPWRLEQETAVRQYETLLVNFPNLQLVDVTREVARKAAQLRAQHELRPADALHVATAVFSNATALISNDKQLQRLTPVLDMVLLDSFT